LYYDIVIFSYHPIFSEQANSLIRSQYSVKRQTLLLVFLWTLYGVSTIPLWMSKGRCPSRIRLRRFTHGKLSGLLVLHPLVSKKVKTKGTCCQFRARHDALVKNPCFDGRTKKNLGPQSNADSPLTRFLLHIYFLSPHL